VILVGNSTLFLNARGVHAEPDELPRHPVIGVPATLFLIGVGVRISLDGRRASRESSRRRARLPGRRRP